MAGVGVGVGVGIVIYMYQCVSGLRGDMPCVIAFLNTHTEC